MAFARTSGARRAQDNLQGTLAAHRAHLQQSALGSSGPPPLLPKGGTLKPRSPQLPHVASESPSSGNDDSCEDPIRRNLPRQSESPSSTSSRTRNSIRNARSFSLEAFDRSSEIEVDAVDVEGATSKPNSSSSSRATPRSSSTRGSKDKRNQSCNKERKSQPSPGNEDYELPRWKPRTEAEEEEDFDADMLALEELCSHLNLRTEERQGIAEIEQRPLTGGTSASASTTVPGGSSGNEVVSIDFEELGVEARPNTDSPFDALQGGQRASFELQQGGALPLGCRLEQTPGAASQYIFTVDACEGPYAPATIPFWIKIFDEFPSRDGVSIRSTKKIFHPNIDQDTGLVRVQQDLMEVDCRFKDLLSAIRQLVLNPADSPVANHEAAMLLQTNPDEFRRIVRTTLAGGEYRGVRFDRVLDFSKKSSSSGYPSSSGQHQSQMSDKTKLDLMQIEVMQVQFKAFSDDMIEQNTKEYQGIESENRALRMKPV